MIVETVSGENSWAEQRHVCYYCRPDLYPPMPEFHTLCARCGQLIFTPEKHDPMNNAMAVCERCEADMAGES